MSDSSHSESFILFELAGKTCGVRSRVVQSVEMVEHVTAVPNALPFVEGVTLTRGHVIPAINLRIRLGFSRIPVYPRARMLVIRLLDGRALAQGCALSRLRFAPGLHSQPLMSKDRTVGMLVDSTREFISIPANAIQPPSEIAGFRVKYVEGIATLGNRSVVILNLEEVIEGE